MLTLIMPSWVVAFMVSLLVSGVFTRLARFKDGL